MDDVAPDTLKEFEKKISEINNKVESPEVKIIGKDEPVPAGWKFMSSADVRANYPEC